jgi:hypothetical protein
VDEYNFSPDGPTVVYIADQDTEGVAALYNGGIALQGASTTFILIACIAAELAACGGGGGGPAGGGGGGGGGSCVTGGGGDSGGTATAARFSTPRTNVSRAITRYPIGTCANRKAGDRPRGGLLQPAIPSDCQRLRCFWRCRPAGG